MTVPAMPVRFRRGMSFRQATLMPTASSQRHPNAGRTPPLPRWGEKTGSGWFFAKNQPDPISAPHFGARPHFGATLRKTNPTPFRRDGPLRAMRRFERDASAGEGSAGAEAEAPGALAGAQRPGHD